MKMNGGMHHVCFTSIFVLFLSFSIISGCSEKQKAEVVQADNQTTEFATEYQAVLLDNGQAFFGKLENVGSPYPVLKDVFYIQRIVNKETNEATNSLIKRGSEWHEPDSMYLNSSHILMIEPVKPGSRVDVLIKDTKAKGAGTVKQ